MLLLIVSGYQSQKEGFYVYFQNFNQEQHPNETPQQIVDPEFYSKA